MLVATTKHILSRQIFVATNIIFVETSLLLSRQTRKNTPFVETKVHVFAATNIILSRQAYFCRDKRRVLSRQTQSHGCRDKTFIATKMILVAAPASDIPREQTATTSLHQSSYVDFLMLRALIRTASGKGGGSNTETEATTRVWHEEPQKLRQFLFLYNDRRG